MKNDTTTPNNDSSGPVWFIGASLVGLALACGMLAGRPGFLMNPVLTGHGLAWMMMLLFAVAMPGIFGAVYWALPRMYGMRLYSEAFVWLHFAFHFVGAALSMVGLFWPELPQAAMGQTFLACGAIVFAVNIGCSLRQVARPDASSAFFTGAMVWLLVATFMGLPFRGPTPFPAFEGTAWSAGWLALVVGGVFLNGLMGMAMRLCPQALGVPQEMTNRGWYALAFTNISLGWIFAAIAFGPPIFLLIATGVFLIGAGIYWIEFYGVLSRRKSRELDWDARILLSAFSVVPVAAGFLGLAAWMRMTAPAPEVVADAEDSAVGLALEFLPLDGAIFLTVMLGAVIPGIVAMVFQLLKLRREAVFSGKFRIADQVLLASFFNYATGVLMVVSGAWVGIGQVLSLGTLFMLIGAVGFIGNFFFTMAPMPDPLPDDSEMTTA